MKREILSAIAEVSRCVSLIVIVMATPVTLATQPEQLEPPKYRLVDEYGINLATGMVTSSLNTVRIGGKMGLSHSIATHTNSFNYRGYYGYNDTFSGNARYTELGENVKFPNAQATEMIVQQGKSFVMRVDSMAGSKDFFVQVNGISNHNATGVSDNYSYLPLGDSRHSLLVSSDRNYLIWTNEAGVVSRFKRDIYDMANSSGVLEDVTFPNGFKITIHGNDSVTTNTGFQLKYNYVDDNRALDPDKLSTTFQNGNNVPLANSLQWSQRNPASIVAINRAIDYCSTANHATCSFSQTWPSATFNWPGGMPRAFYIGDSIFTVTDAIGRTTEYHYTAHDLALIDINDPSSINGLLTFGANTRIAPRLVQIKDATSTVVSHSYTYQNQFDYGPSGTFSAAYSWLKTEQGKVITADTPKGSTTYNLYAPFGTGQSGEPLRNNNGQQIEVIANQSYVGYPNTLYQVNETGISSILFENNYRNFVRSESDSAGPDKELSYDTRGNLQFITMNGGTSDETVIEARYPSTCGNIKICNKPTWTEDAKGNRTDYTYHLQSGQIESLTLPADSNGIRPQTRYQYTQYFAKFKINSNSITVSPDGIWLLSSESYCINSIYNGTSCSGNDEVITTFEYDENNLYLIGKAVTADNETLLTCYEYDIYGNQIGETRPKANLSTCL